MMIHEECNAAISVMLEDYYGVSSVEELKNTYCVIEDLSGQPILWRMIGVKVGQLLNEVTISIVA